MRFVNRTPRKVDIVWINFEGSCVRYRTLYPGHSVNVNTFVGHPWIFRDSDTGDKLVAQFREVYEPIGWSPVEGVPPQRKQVHITLPGRYMHTGDGYLVP